MGRNAIRGDDTTVESEVELCIGKKPHQVWYESQTSYFTRLQSRWRGPWLHGLTCSCPPSSLIDSILHHLRPTMRMLVVAV